MGKIKKKQQVIEKDNREKKGTCLLVKATSKETGTAVGQNN